MLYGELPPIEIVPDGCEICDSDLEDGDFIDYWLGYDQDFDALADVLAVKEGVYAHPEEHKTHYQEHLDHDEFNLWPLS